MNFIERNKKALDIFLEHGLDVRAIGSKEKPIFVLNDHIGLACFCHKDEMIFVDKPFNGKKVFKVDLTQLRYDDTDFDKWFRDSEHREMFRVKMKDSKLFYNGYRDKGDKRYPIFCEVGCSSFFNVDKAQEVLDHYPEYDLIIV